MYVYVQLVIPNQNWDGMKLFECLLCKLLPFSVLYLMFYKNELLLYYVYTYTHYLCTHFETLQLFTELTAHEFR